MDLTTAVRRQYSAVHLTYPKFTGGEWARHLTDITICQTILSSLNKKQPYISFFRMFLRKCVMILLDTVSTEGTDSRTVTRGLFPEPCLETPKKEQKCGKCISSRFRLPARGGDPVMGRPFVVQGYRFATSLPYVYLC